MSDASSVATVPAPNATSAVQCEPGRLFNAEDFVVADLQPPEIWNRIVTMSVRERASDVHITVQRQGAEVSVRLDGRVCSQGRLPADVGYRVINHVKVVAGLDPAERRRPHDGRISERVDERLVDLRIAILPTRYGESVAIRIQDREAGLRDLDTLGMTARQLRTVSGLIDAPSGLVLVTGATGSGKTTSLYAILKRLADGARRVVTVETPIEYELDGVEQCEVNYRIGVDYAVLLKAALRQDANVIMIGEVRDTETAETVVRAANAGRLVLATTHAVNAASAVESLIALGAHPHFVARSFRGAIAQTLVRRSCPECSETFGETGEQAMFEDVRHLLDADEQPSLSLGRGCAHCRFTGYRGRQGVFELLVANDEIREMIDNGAPARGIHERAVANGMITLGQAGKLAALRGLTTTEELVQHVSEIWTN